MRCTVGRTYLTRNGRECLIYHDSGEYAYGVADGIHGIWRIDGRIRYDSFDHDMDLTEDITELAAA